MQRRYAVLVACLACAIVAPAAVGSPDDVVADYTAHNAQITQCHSREDYVAARELRVDDEYGDFPGAIDTALANPKLVGTAAQPCPAVEASSSSGLTTAALLLIPAAGLLAVAGAIVLRRRRAAGADTTEPPA